MPTGSATAIAGCGSVPLTQVTGSTWIASCTTSALSAGSHPVSASYSGDSSYLSSSGNLAWRVEGEHGAADDHRVGRVDDLRGRRLR